MRFVLVMLSAAAAFALLMALTPAHAEQAEPGIQGHWAGRYVCAQGITALQLDITAKGDAVEAVFSFGPLPENPSVPKGRYRMTGAYEPSTRRVALEGAQWLEAPFGYVMVDLDGRLSQAGDRIAGHVPGPGCTSFEVRRQAELVG